MCRLCFAFADVVLCTRSVQSRRDEQILRRPQQRYLTSDHPRYGLQRESTVKPSHAGSKYSKTFVKDQTIDIPMPSKTTSFATRMSAS